MAATFAVDPGLRDSAEHALERMRAHGFEHAQVSASRALRTEVNIAHSEPALLRSVETVKLALAGIVGGRKASTELAELGDGAPGGALASTTSLDARIAALRADANLAPQDAAHAVSSAQRAEIVRGETESSLDELADAAAELLAFRAREAPRAIVDESFVAHTHRQQVVLTSGGSELVCRLGWCEASALATAREGSASSSFAFASGSAERLRGVPLSQRFGLGDMLRALERQIGARPLGESFIGSVVLTPQAVNDLLGWLLGQVGDMQLIGGTSLYRDQVGAAIASPLVAIESRFDAPGVAPLSADAFVATPVRLLTAGVLRTLLPSLYGSRKTGLPHVPTAEGGWMMAAGDRPLAELIGGVARGALVGRLSMGRPASNGDFSGVAKNSFLIEGGEAGRALAETMITGNVAQMLRDVSGVSVERLDEGALLLPWLRVENLRFS
jgi:PmbA protein